MTMVETGKILALIYAIFPRAYEKQGAEATRNAWAVMFEDERYDVVQYAVKQVLKRSKFAPTISEVFAEIGEYKRLLKSKLQSYENYYFADLPKRCSECALDPDEDVIEMFKKCAGHWCPKQINEERKKQSYLTDQEVKAIKEILASPSTSQKLLGSGK